MDIQILAYIRCVIFRSQGHGSQNFVTLISRGDAGTRKIPRNSVVHPGAAQFVEESATDCREAEGVCQLVLGEVMHLEFCANGVANGGKANASQHVAVLIVDGVAIRHIGLVGYDGISAIGIGAVGGMGGISHTQAVGVCIAHIRRALLHVALILGIAAHVKHGRFCPTAVEAQHRDRMLRTLDAFRGGCTFGIHEAFHISAAGVLLAECSSCAVLQRGSDGHSGGAVCRNRNTRTGVKRHGHVQRRCSGVHIVALILIKVHAVGKDVLGKEIGRQIVGFLRSSQVVEGEGERIRSLPLRVVSQLHLTLPSA